MELPIVQMGRTQNLIFADEKTKKLQYTGTTDTTVSLFVFSLYS